MKVFYTYLWLREDGTPYYVGKGTGDRAFRKRKLHNPPTHENILIQDYPDEASAFAAEKFLIALYGRKNIGTGCLWNLTDGGEGTSGAVYSVRSRERISYVARNRSPEHRTKLGAAHRGKVISVGQRALNSAARRGRKHSPETCARISRTLKGRVISDAQKVKLREAAIRRYAK